MDWPIFLAALGVLVAIIIGAWQIYLARKNGLINRTPAIGFDKTSKDTEVLDLGFNFALYAIALAAAAGVSKIPAEDPYRQKTIDKADELTENLRRSILRCGLSVKEENLKSASELGSYDEIMAFLLNKSNQLAQKITDEIVAKLGNRQEQIFLFAVQFGQAIGAKSFGESYNLDQTEMVKRGVEIGFSEDRVRNWVAFPTEKVFSEIRQELETIQ